MLAFNLLSKSCLQLAGKDSLEKPKQASGEANLWGAFSLKPSASRHAPSRLPAHTKQSHKRTPLTPSSPGSHPDTPTRTANPPPPIPTMKCIAALSLASILGAQAFVAPAPKFSRTRGVAKMAFSDEAGVTAPLGYWDPLGFSADGGKCLPACLPGWCLGLLPWPPPHIFARAGPP